MFLQNCSHKKGEEYETSEPNANQRVFQENKIYTLYKIYSFFEQDQWNI